MSAHWTELPVVVAGRRALDQALRQWKHYADENRSLDHGRALGETGMLEDRMYESCKAAAEGLEAAADDSDKARDGRNPAFDCSALLAEAARLEQTAARMEAEAKTVYAPTEEMRRDFAARRLGKAHQASEAARALRWAASANAEVSDGGPLTPEPNETRTRRSLH